MDLKRSATILEVVMSLGTVLGVIITAYITITVTQARQDERIKTLENNYRDITIIMRDLTTEVRDLNKNIMELKLDLKDKQDRIK